MNKMMSTAGEITAEEVSGLEPKKRSKAIVALLNLYNNLSVVNRVDVFSKKTCIDSGFDPSGLDKNDTGLIIDELLIIE